MMQQLKAEYNKKLHRAIKAWDWAETATPAEFDKHFKRFDALNREIGALLTKIRKAQEVTRRQILNGFEEVGHERR